MGEARASGEGNIPVQTGRIPVPERASHSLSVRDPKLECGGLRELRECDFQSLF